MPSLSNADRFMAEVIPLVNKPGDSATVNASFAASQPNSSTINDQSMVDLPLHDILPHNSSAGGSGPGKAKNRVKHKNVLSSHSSSSQFLSQITRLLFNLNHHNYQPIPNDNDDDLNSSTESLVQKSQVTDADGVHTGCCCTCSGCFK